MGIWFRFLALYVGLTAVYAWPLLLSVGSALPSDPGDPALNSWILWWNTQATPLTEVWWNAPIFFPMRDAFALSETLLGVAPVTTPIMWLGGSPVLAYNVVFLATFPLAALAAHALAFRLTARHDAALIAGLAFAFSTYRAAHLAHLHLLLAFWLPLGLLMLHRWLDSRRPTDLALAAVCWLFAGLSSGYFLIFFAVFILLWAAWFVRRWQDVLAMGVAFGLAGAAMLPLLLNYRARQAALGLERLRIEIETFSADLSDLWAASGHIGLARFWTRQADAEGELYPGLTIAMLAVVGAVAAWRALPPTRRPTVSKVLAALGVVVLAVAGIACAADGIQFSVLGVSISATRPYRVLSTAVWLLGAAALCDRRLLDGWRRRSTLMFYGLAAIAMLLLALGPVGRVFDLRFLYQAPYAWLMAMPGGLALRVPSRFVVLMLLCLGQAAALAFARLTPGGARRSLVALLAAAVLVEGWVVNMPVAPVPAPLQLAAYDERAVVFELPLADYANTLAELRSIDHGRPLINGYSGYEPKHFVTLRDAVRDRDPGLLEALQQFAPILVVVNQDLDRYRAFIESAPGASLVDQGPDRAIYLLPQRAVVPVEPVGDRLTISAIEGTGDFAEASLALDGDVGTRWSTPGPQQPGHELVATFDAPVTVSRVEMTLGPWELDYPRGLRVSVANAGEEPVVLWEGQTAGRALLAALEDPLTIPVRIDLPPGPAGTRLILSSIGSHEALHWSVTELRVFGRR